MFRLLTWPDTYSSWNGCAGAEAAAKDCPLLGIHGGRAVYLLYNGVLGDKRPGWQRLDLCRVVRPSAAP